MNAVLQPNHPGLALLEAQVRDRLGPDAPARVVLATVQQVVNLHVPYEYDWNLWGVMDWLPTVDETLRASREDCDGRAVVAASLLRRMGYRAWLVSDYTHTWVACDLGETMAPRATAQSMVAGEDGTRTRVDFTLAENLLRGAGFGITVFPPLRLVILLVVIVCAAANPFVGVARQVVGAVGIFTAYGAFPIAARLADGGEHLPASLIATLFTVAIGGWCAMVVRVRRANRPDGSLAARPE
ncbi:MAG: transglutaminase family protein [Phycisphaerales bacterium]|nr:transglutaminase family protein [Phycisphaerales bacterium]